MCWSVSAELTGILIPCSASIRPIVEIPSIIDSYCNCSEMLHHVNNLTTLSRQLASFEVTSNEIILTYYFIWQIVIVIVTQSE